MRCLLPATVYCISLFSLQQLLAVPVGNRLQRSSLELLLGRPLEPVQGGRPLPQQLASSSIPVDGPDANPSLALDKTALWRALLVRGAPLTSSEIATATVTDAHAMLDGEDGESAKRRGRRHASSGTRGHHHAHVHHGHPQLMRVGCVLGTCQVQNLSHRLYQLIGQSGRDDSSPVNPRSPHSYG